MCRHQLVLTGIRAGITPFSSDQTVGFGFVKSFGIAAMTVEMALLADMCAVLLPVPDFRYQRAMKERKYNQGAFCTGSASPMISVVEPLS